MAIWAHYLASLEKLTRARRPRFSIPPMARRSPIRSAWLGQLIAHRRMREDADPGGAGAAAPDRLPALVEKLYPDIDAGACAPPRRSRSRRIWSICRRAARSRRSGGRWRLRSGTGVKKALSRAALRPWSSSPSRLSDAQIDPAADGAGRAHPDHDVADAPEPEALVGGFDAQILFAGIDNGPAQLLAPLQSAPIGFLRRHQQARHAAWSGSGYFSCRA